MFKKKKSAVVILTMACSLTLHAADIESKDTVVVVSEAGTLSKVFPAETWTDQAQRDSVMQTFTGLKIQGKLNGNDIVYLQTVCGSWAEVMGNVEKLDLSEASIVAGGDAYSTYYNTEGYSEQLYTADRVVGAKMFSYCGALKHLVLPSNTVSVSANAFDGTSLDEIEISDANAYYKSEDGVLYDNAFTTLVKYPSANARTSFVIPSSITEINASAFENSSSLTILTIPSTLKRIGESAFGNCNSLTAIDLPKEMEAIGDRAFMSCMNLQTISMPTTIASIGHSLFMGCSALKEVSLPSGTLDISRMFYGCQSLEKVTLPSSIKTFGESAFQSCSSLQSVNVPVVEEIGESAFDGCKSLEQLVIPEGVKRLGSRAFASCTALSYLSLPSTIDSVGDYLLSFASYDMDLVLKAIVPPAASSSSFYPAPYGIRLYVPDANVDDYANAEGWKAFSSINKLSDAPASPISEYNILSEEYVPDELFRAWIDTNLANGSGYFSNKDAEAYKGEIFIGYTDIASLQGIEYFTSIESIALTNNNNLVAVDLHKNTGLRKIDLLYSMSLVDLNIEGLQNLEVLNVGMTNIANFDLSRFTYLAPTLKELNVSKLQLETIDVTPFVNLETLDVSSNQLTTIDCSNLSKLKLFSCSNMPTLTSINLKGCVALEELIASMCDLTDLDLSDNQALNSIYVHENKNLGNIELTPTVKSQLRFLNIGNTGCTSVNLDGCVNLEEFECPTNALEQAPSFKDCKKLNWLRIESTGISDLDVSSCPELKELYCYSNNLENLDISKNEKLERLICFENGKNGMKEIKVWSSFDIDYPPIDCLKDDNTKFVYEFSTADIARPSFDANPSTTISRYDMSGRKLTGKVNGLNIIVKSDGKVIKSIER